MENKTETISSTVQVNYEGDKVFVLTQLPDDVIIDEYTYDEWLELNR